MRWSRVGVVRYRVAAVAGVCVLSGCVLSATGAPHVVAAESVRLTGVLNASEYEHTVYWFEYGATANYGAASPHTDIDVGFGQTPVSAMVHGLTSATTYHYRLCNDKVPSDAFAPHCGDDRVVTTVVGRVSVDGTGSDVTFQGFPPVTVSTQFSLSAAADPGGTGYVDGDEQASAQTRHVPQLSRFDFNSGESGRVACLRVSGNLAVAGVSGTGRGELVDGSAGDDYTFNSLIVVEDNGTVGDRLAVLAWTPADGCPEPSVSLFPSPTFANANFVVRGG